MKSWLVSFCLLSLSAASLGAERLDEIKARGELRVCIWPEYYGISFRNTKSGAVAGVDADMARDLAAHLGVPLNFVDSHFARLKDDLLRNQCDVGMFAVAITPARQAVMEFTQPHMFSDVYAVTSRTNSVIQNWQDIDRPGRVVAEAAGTYHEPLMRERLQYAKLLVVSPPATREGEVESGRADVFMSDYPFTRRMVKDHDWVRIIAPPKPFYLVNYAYAVAPGQARWLATLNQFIQNQQRSGRLRQLTQRYDLQLIVRDSR